MSVRTQARLDGQANVAVIGASGFVGLALLEHLRSAGVRVTAVVRGLPDMLGDFMADHEIVRADEVDSQFDVVINLAYPTAEHQAMYGRATTAIVDTIGKLTRPGGRVIHVSTCAVFGPALEREVVHGPAPRARDTAYVETKIAAEYMVADLYARLGGTVEIVRLGNVVGPRAPGWGVTLMHRILTGRPVLVAGAPGRSNATDVRNVASYLAFLATRNGAKAELRYHHLAELSDVPWRAWLGPMAEELGVPLVYAAWDDLRQPVGLQAQMASALGALRPRAIYRSLNEERLPASLIRSGLSMLPPSAFGRLKGPDVVEPPAHTTSRDEQTFLSIMSGATRFEARLLSEWAPDVSAEESVNGTLAWLRRN